MLRLSSIVAIAAVSCFGQEAAAPRPARPVVPTTVAEIAAGRIPNTTLVRLTGVIADAYPDETDSHYIFLVLKDGLDTIYVGLKKSTPDTYARTVPLIGATVAITGGAYSYLANKRIRLGCSVVSYGFETIEVLKPAPDPYFVPELELLANISPDKVALLGRHRTTGRVIARWKPNAFLLRTQRSLGEASNMVVRIECISEELPACGATVEVAGLPETDLYRINFSRAIWRNAPALPLPPEDTTPVSAWQILNGDPRGHGFFYGLNGSIVRLSGIVRALPNDVEREQCVYIDENGVTVPVDVSALPRPLPEIELGAKLEVTGACVFDLDNWRPNAAFPQIKGFRIVPRTDEDLRVVAPAPWWTPARFWSVIGSLAALLVAIFAWNLSLRRLAERRGRQLAAESVAHAESDLKNLERTRLAVELHDSIAQYLTGSSMEVRTAIQSYRANEPDTEAHLAIALKTIDASRGELRNCIWNLRNSTLESQDPNDAIRIALAPHLGDTELSARFNIPRERLRDETMHAILCIVRELTVNAIRHGGATKVRVAAAIENGCLLCSVTDNGCGFAPESAPGMEEGHFGLQGIRERLKERRGTLTFESAPGKGTKATISIKLRNATDR